MASPPGYQYVLCYLTVPDDLLKSTGGNLTTKSIYADLAERYEADSIYDLGTVVALGGVKEITQTITPNDKNVFGVISATPAFEMNTGAGNDRTHPFVALAGRIKCKVVGKIHKGDRLVSAEEPGHAQAESARVNPSSDRAVIGRALESKDTGYFGVIEIVVGIK